MIFNMNNNSNITFPGKYLKQGLSIDTHMPAYGFSIGETIYTVCDKVGYIFSTTIPSELEKFFVEIK